MRTTLALLALALLAAGCGARHRAVAAPPPPPKPTLFAPISVSSNWGGYVVTRRNGGGFRRASGTWTMPRIRCVAGQGSSAAFWVGIGGFGATSPSLQQLGASADCSPQGAISYRLW